MFDPIEKSLYTPFYKSYFDRQMQKRLREHYEQLIKTGIVRVNAIGIPLIRAALGEGK